MRQGKRIKKWNMNVRQQKEEIHRAYVAFLHDFSPPYFDSIMMVTIKFPFMSDFSILWFPIYVTT